MKYYINIQFWKVIQVKNIIYIYDFRSISATPYFF